MCLVCLSCSSAACWSSGSGSNCRGTLLFFVSQQQPSLPCYDVIGCWLWNTWGNKNLIEPQLSAPHFSCILGFSGFIWSSCFCSCCSPTVVSLLVDPGEIHLLLFKLLIWENYYWLLLMFFSVLAENFITESTPCRGPQRPPASSVEVLHVSTRPAILRQHH